MVSPMIGLYDGAREKIRPISTPYSQTYATDFIVLRSHAENKNQIQVLLTLYLYHKLIKCQ